MNRLNIQLVEQAMVGDKEAFSELVDCYKNTVYSLALSRVCNPADAEDLTQDVFLQAYEGLHTLKDASKLPQWLRGIAINKCKMWKRGRSKTFSYDFLSESEEEGEGELLPASLYAPSFEEELEKRELWDEVLSAVYALSEDYRLVVLLYYLDEMSQKEIGEFLGISVTAVETRLHRAKGQLREEMAKRMETGLKGEKLSDDFTKKVQRTIPERFEQLIEQSFEVSPEDTVVVYHDLGVSGCHAWASLYLQGSDKGYVSIRKNLFGNTVDEARERQEQIKIVVEKRRNLFDDGPLEGEMWWGTQVRKDGPYPFYISRKKFWEELKALWREKDEEAYFLLKRLLQGEVILIAAAGDHIDFIRMPSERAASRFFRPYSMAADYSMGPAGNVEMTVHIFSPCRNVIFIGNGIISITDINADITLFSNGFLSFSANGIHGIFRAYGATPIKLEDVNGDVVLHNPFCRRPGVNIEDKLIHRIGVPSQTRIRHIAGALQISCKDLNLDVSSVQGNLQIENLFGETKVFISEYNADDAKFDFRNVSGSISIILSKEADEKMSVGMWTECGTINYKKWGKENILQMSNPSIIYAGSLPPNNGEEANFKIRTQCGAITIKKE